MARCLARVLAMLAEDYVTRLIVPYIDRIERLDPQLAAEIERAANVVLNGEAEDW